MGYSIISDVAGQFQSLMALVKKMPDDEVISIGDMIDRGPDSDRVLVWFMKHGKAILGNHEHMMIDHQNSGLYYEDGVWFANGGLRTLESYGFMIPPEVVTWLEHLPMYMIIDGCLVSHAFLNKSYKLIDQALNLGTDAVSTFAEMSILWNRGEPIRRPEHKLQITGHNSQMGLKWFEDRRGPYAVCLDDSKKKRLTGIHIPSYTIYQQEYL